MCFSNGGGSGCVRKHEGTLVMTCAGCFYAAMTKYQQNNLAKEGVVPAHCFRVQVMVSWPCEAEHSITVVGEDRRRQLFLGGQKAKRLTGSDQITGTPLTVSPSQSPSLPSATSQLGLPYYDRRDTSALITLEPSFSDYFWRHRHRLPQGMLCWSCRCFFIQSREPLQYLRFNGSHTGSSVQHKMGQLSVSSYDNGYFYKK